LGILIGLIHKMLRRLFLTVLSLTSVGAFAAPAAAQLQRVMINAQPTNMVANWAQVLAVPDSSQPNTFLALMPLSVLSTWAEWDPDQIMDLQFGGGNWSRMSMTASAWAYLSPDVCAHQPALGATHPESLLTSDFDNGPYIGVQGGPLFASAGATVFSSSTASIVGGLTGSSFSRERWQLRTRGFFPSMLWNACPNAGSITPTFSGFIGVRFTYQVL
jgi:hypothetical protein